MPVDVAQVQRILSEREDVSWTAASTVVSQLSPEQQRLRLGAAVPEGMSLQEIVARAEQQEADMAAARAVAAPAAYDLRNVNGQNFITPIKDQGGCGSCVAFGTCAAIEGTLRVQQRDPSLRVDLSEAHLFYCHARNEGRNCSNGWWTDRALTACRDTGVVDEACYPYTAGDQTCNVCGDWRNRLTKIRGFRSLTSSPAQMKEWISTRGPLTACFVVYEDFYAYRSGVYRHVSGNQVGGHCVSIVGYDDGQGCWICKNSWGAGWGESGFFRIAYGQVGIDTWAVHGVDGVEIGPWGGWASLGGVITTDPVAGRNQDGRLEVFARGTDNALWHIWQTARNNGWSGWASLGGVITSNPAVGRNQDGRLEVFVRGTDNALWHKWQTAPNNGWSGWVSLGGVITTDPVVAQNADGRLEVFVRGTDNALWHKWQTSPGGGWSGWASRGGVITSVPAVSRNADGRLEVFARGTDNALWQIWQTAPNNGWSGWASLGGVITTDPVVAQNADGRLEVFVRGTDNALWHRWQTAPNNGWSGWASRGGVITTAPALSRNADGRLEAFARGTDNALWHIWQTAPNSGWSGWASLGGAMAGRVTVGQNADGRLEVFARGAPDNALRHRWQTSPNNGWS